jgi:hypothetical protein
MTKPAPSILDVISRPAFAPWFGDGETWQAWFAFLAALFGLPMTPEQLAIYRECTGRQHPPTTPHRQAVLICGRRSGKSFIMALVATFLAAFRDWRPFLSPGGKATIMVIARDRDQAGEIINYVKSYFQDVPMLAKLLERETAEGVELKNRVRIQVNSASYTRTRGFAIAVAILDELAFWPSDAASANPDKAIFAAVRYGMGQFGDQAMLLCASSPYAKRGVLFDLFSQHYGKDDSEVLVWQAPTRRMNPLIAQADVDAAMERDPHDALSEYMAQFRSDLASFVDPEVVRLCTDPVRERLPQRGICYSAFVDMSGGSQDSAGLAICHAAGKEVILDLVHEVPAPHSPNAAVETFAGVLRRYQIWNVTGDHYAGEWPREAFLTHGIGYEVSEKNKSALYQAFLPLLNSYSARLIEHPRMANQLINLERKVTRGGRDSIDHPPYQKDDLANCVAGAMVMAQELGAMLPAHRLQSHAVSEWDHFASDADNLKQAAIAERRQNWDVPDDRQLWQTHAVAE